MAQVDGINLFILTSGGVTGECPPNPSDNVFFDANSFVSINDSVVIGATTAYCKNTDWTGATQNPFLSGNCLQFKNFWVLKPSSFHHYLI